MLMKKSQHLDQQNEKIFDENNLKVLKKQKVI